MSRWDKASGVGAYDAVGRRCCALFEESYYYRRHHSGGQLPLKRWYLR